MNEIEIFKNSEFEIRVVAKDNEPLFCLADVCKILDMQNPQNVKNAIDTEFDKQGIFDIHSFDTGYGVKELIMINEAELYFVLMRSDKPKAKPFRMWVNSEVLPSIRKHGAYMTPETIEQALLNPDMLITLATTLKAERAKREALEAEKIANLPYVSFGKSVEASIDSVLIGTYAKLLSDSEGVSIGEKRLFEWLRVNGYLITGGARHNVPYQKYVDNGYFEVTTQTFAGSTGAHQRFTTKITGKGQIALAGKIVKAFKEAA